MIAMFIFGRSVMGTLISGDADQVDRVLTYACEQLNLMLVFFAVIVSAVSVPVGIAGNGQCFADDGFRIRRVIYTADCCVYIAGIDWPMGNLSD